MVLDLAILYPACVNKLILAVTSASNSKRNDALFSSWASYLESGMDLGLWFRNIFYWTGPDARLFATGPLDESVIHIDNNLYYTGGNDVLLRNGDSFAKWQERGFDTHSLIADPVFVDPSTGDYSLKPESPAPKLGFEPIDTSEIGLLTKRTTE